jgi:hypothetical protein
MPFQVTPVYPQYYQPTLFRGSRYEFYGSGVNTWTKPPAQNPEMFEKLDNCFPGYDVIRRRWGYTSFANPGFDARRLGIYENQVTASRKIIASSTSGINAYNEDGTVYRSGLFSTSGFTVPARMVNSRNYEYFVPPTGTFYKWDGSSSNPLTQWGIVAPSTALSVGSPTSGAITLQSGRNYFVVYQNTTTGHLSDLSPVSASTGPLAAKQVPLSNIPVSGDSQVNQKIILATLDGGDETTLYFLTSLSNATVTYTDNTPDTTLALNQVYASLDDFGISHGCVFNTPPPAGTVPIKHNGRLFMIYGQMLAVSKSLDEMVTSTGVVAGNYEEAWPSAWQIDISQGSETPRALLSDGTVLYVGDERTVRVIAGDSILNFSEPQLVFNDAGVLSQEVWQRVFKEGQPVGAMWLTPDFRVIQSDFNTYVDVGQGIQDLLSTINTNAVANACAMAVSDGEYDLYILAIPTGSNTDPDTLCIYNMRTQTWAVWTLPDPVVGMLYNITASGTIQEILASNGTNKRLWLTGRNYSQDRVGVSATNITSTIRTGWLSLTDHRFRKILNDMDVMTQDTGLTVTVEGATTVADFTSPISVVSNTPLVQGVLGAWKVYLASSTTKYRFYRFTFTSTGQQLQVLNGFSVEFIQMQV